VPILGFLEAIVPAIYIGACCNTIIDTENVSSAQWFALQISLM